MSANLQLPQSGGGSNKLCQNRKTLIHGFVGANTRGQQLVVITSMIPQYVGLPKRFGRSLVVRGGDCCWISHPSCLTLLFEISPCAHTKCCDEELWRTRVYIQKRHSTASQGIQVKIFVANRVWHHQPAPFAALHTSIATYGRI
jgi:hypothetical protein